MTYREKYKIDLNTLEGIKKVEKLDCAELPVKCKGEGCFVCKAKALLKEIDK